MQISLLSVLGLYYSKFFARYTLITLITVLIYNSAYNLLNKLTSV